MSAYSFLYKLNPLQSFNYNICRRFLKSTVSNSGHYGNNIAPSVLSGTEFLSDPRLNRGLAFSLEERQSLGLHGLLPARIKTQDEQSALCKISMDRYEEPINKYLYLLGLLDRNEHLFYKLFSQNIEAMLPIVYTPTVGLACQKYGLLFRRARGLFITINDKNHVYDVIKNWPEPDVRAIVVTDGERILGLGDLGSYGMGIPVGKLCLYTALGGVQPHQCLPILLDVGTNNKELLEDPMYVGLRRKRVAGKEYDEFIAEFMCAVVRRYGQKTLIQFEDFGSHNAFPLLDRYRHCYCTFNDDIQGTASVCVAGLIAAERITKKKLTDQTYFFFGAGQACLGTATLLVKALQIEGMKEEDALKKIYVFDVDGLLVKKRTGKSEVKGVAKLFVKDMEPATNFSQLIKDIKPSILIGASTVKGAFTEEILKLMASFNERPIIYALSNPTSKAECTAEEAYTHTKGKCLFASGSPFPPFKFNGKTLRPGQGNNAYIFPGVSLAVISAEIYHVTEEIFLVAAAALASMITEEDLEAGSIFPPVSKLRDASLIIARSIVTFAYEHKLASRYPPPTFPLEDDFFNLYNYNYNTEGFSVQYPWPKQENVKVKPLQNTKVVDALQYKP